MKQIMDEQLNNKWQTIPCHTGKECWCRMIVTKDYDETTQEDDTLVCHAGALTKNVAEHVVKLHNNFIDVKSQLIYDVLSTIDSFQQETEMNKSDAEELKSRLSGIINYSLNNNL